MKERANAILFIAIAIAVVSWWVWPQPYLPVGDMHNRKVIGITVWDVDRTSFRTGDTLFIQRFTLALDGASRIHDVIGRNNRGYFQCRFELADSKPIHLDILCHTILGPVIHHPGDFAGSSLDSAVAMISAKFPEGKWCSIQP